jgi:hypothetical protein
MHREECPKSRKSIRIKQPKTLESKIFHTFPGMGGGTFVKHFFQLDLTLRVRQRFLNEEPAHTNGFIVFCNGVESGFMARAYEPGSLTRKSHDTGQYRKH